ncbi:hypothetical protein BEE12_16185 [Pantoea agglomerans]|uniref:hypothetical protein n=1 Tax=Enterobacter agglomerans TaxID=549 RepID=UPI00083D65D4|nr:hypothetical protein [Pantoea agglomerans]AOE41255.1 hypothetical protein BEE12_16185 [Pantoea agglomerans]
MAETRQEMLQRIAREAADAAQCAKEGKPHPRRMARSRLAPKIFDKPGGNQIAPPMAFILADDEGE